MLEGNCSHDARAGFDVTRVPYMDGALIPDLE